MRSPDRARTAGGRAVQDASESAAWGISSAARRVGRQKGSGGAVQRPPPLRLGVSPATLGVELTNGARFFYQHFFINPAAPSRSAVL